MIWEPQDPLKVSILRSLSAKAGIPFGNKVSKEYFNQIHSISKLMSFTLSHQYNVT